MYAFLLGLLGSMREVLVQPVDLIRDRQIPLAGRFGQLVQSASTDVQQLGLMAHTQWVGKVNHLPAHSKFSLASALSKKLIFSACCPILM